MNVNLQCLKPVSIDGARKLALALVVLLAACVMVSCDSDLDTRGVDPAADQPANSGTFELQSGTDSIAIDEGGTSVSIPITIVRNGGSSEPVQLSVQASNGNDLAITLDDTTIEGGESSTQLNAQLFIGARPLIQQNRIVTVSGTNAQGATSNTTVTLSINPTARPDIYLLIGQSNMVGISERDARLDGPGQPDEPSPRIMQLNVTGNDNTFSSPEDFTDPAKLYNNGQPITPALDPLHQGFESSGSKTGTRIGLGLSFAKAALADTTADILLVPAAWSDTGFCKRGTNIIDGVGWNATAKNNQALSGTLLHDRAIARTNAAIDETGGILRGILWHQGEADSDDAACANIYSDNLTELVSSLRSNIKPDARGPQARNSAADIPFIAGTMAMGGEQAPFSQTKALVDATHRTLASIVQFADFVNADDLVPPGFACGGGSCIHFGADAYRELGRRYYDALKSVLPNP